MNEVNKCYQISPHVYIDNLNNILSFFSRPTPIGGREMHIGWIREEEGGGGRREEGGTLSSTNREPEWLHYTCVSKARPGHRAVSIRMDCVLVLVPTSILHCTTMINFASYNKFVCTADFLENYQRFGKKRQNISCGLTKFQFSLLISSKVSSYFCFSPFIYLRPDRSLRANLIKL